MKDVSVLSKERLTERCKGKTFCPRNVKCASTCERCEHLDKMMDKLSDYEDLEEQDLLLRLPCKVGDILYVIYGKRVLRVKCTGYTIQKDTMNKIDYSYIWIDSQESERDYWKINFKDFKEQCFLSQSEAEGKLREE